MIFRRIARTTKTHRHFTYKCSVCTHRNKRNMTWKLLQSFPVSPGRILDAELYRDISDYNQGPDKIFPPVSSLEHWTFSRSQPRDRSITTHSNFPGDTPLKPAKHPKGVGPSPRFFCQACSSLRASSHISEHFFTSSMDGDCCGMIAKLRVME